MALSADADVQHSGSSAPTLLLDAGTGLRQVPALLNQRPYKGSILLSHLHWDHVQGLPFFKSGDHPGAQVTLLIPPQEDGADAEHVLARMMSPPLFPIGPHQLRGNWRFGVLPPAAFSDDGVAVESFRMTAREVPHKGGRTVGYRISDGHASLAYLPDHCPTEIGPGPDGWGAYHPAALELARHVDLLIHDAHLFPDELAAEASFGHAAADYAVGLGAHAGARQVVLFHHKPDRRDDDLDRLVARFASAAPTVRGAFDGLELDL